jgi:adenylate cyclase
MRHNPHHPERFWSHLGKAHFAARHYAEAIDAFRHLSAMDHVQHAFVAAAHGWLGDQAAAQSHMKKVRTLAPDFTTEAFLSTLHYAHDSDVQHIQEGLARADA